MPDDDNEDDGEEDMEERESTPAATTHVTTTRHRTKKRSGGSKEVLGISNDQLAIGAALTSLGIAVALAYKQFGEPYLQNMQQQQLEDQRRNYYMQQQQYEQQRQRQLEDQQVAEEDDRIERARQLKIKSRLKGAATPETAEETAATEDESDLTFSNNKNVSGPVRITGNENVQNVKTGITEEMERRNKEKAAIMKKRRKDSPFGNSIGNLNL